MYRKLMALPLLLFLLLVLLSAYGVALPVWPRAMAVEPVRSGLLLALRFALENLAPFLLAVLLALAAAVQPARRYSRSAMIGKGLAAFGLLVLSLTLIYQRGTLTGMQTRTLAQQSPKPLPLLFAAVTGPHAVLEMLALSAVLAWPFYWMVRGLAVHNFGRAAFEGWLEVKRRYWLWALVLAAAAFFRVYLSPWIAYWAL